MDVSQVLKIPDNGQDGDCFRVSPNALPPYIMASATCPAHCEDENPVTFGDTQPLTFYSTDSAIDDIESATRSSRDKLLAPLNMGSLKHRLRSELQQYNLSHYMDDIETRNSDDFSEDKELDCQAEYSASYTDSPTSSPCALSWSDEENGKVPENCKKRPKHIPESQPSPPPPSASVVPVQQKRKCQRKKPSVKCKIVIKKKKRKGLLMREGKQKAGHPKISLESEPVEKVKYEKKPKKRKKRAEVKGRQEVQILSEETGLFIPPLRPPKTAKSSKSILPSSLPTSHAPPTTTSVLLALMAQAVSAPKYTSVTTDALSHDPSDLLNGPRCSSWPLLRKLIAAPSLPALTISSAPRQSLSTVHVEPDKDEEPAPNIALKLEKEIKCECKFNKGKPCWLLFNEDVLKKERLHHLKMKRESLDLVVLAKIAANINREEKTRKRPRTSRQRCRLCYFHEGRQICRETFLFIHGICKGRLCALLKHYKDQGISTRVHGNKANIPVHALTCDDNQRVLDFIRDYANDHCVSSFGRKPGSKGGGGLLIMSPSQSKLYVHYKYKQWCTKNKKRAVSLRSFQNLWTKHLPYIVVLRGSNKTPVPETVTDEEGLNMCADEDASSVERTCKMTETWTGASNFQIPLFSVGLNQPVGGLGLNSGPSVIEESGKSDLLLSEEKKKRKRKAMPPRKVEPSTSISLAALTETDFGGTNGLYDDIPLSLHSSNNNQHNSNNNNDSNNNANGPQHIGDGISVSPLTNLPPASLFPQEPIITSSSSSSSSAAAFYNPAAVAAAAVDLHNRNSASVMLPGAYNGKMASPILKAASSLCSGLYLSQPSQLLEPFPMHCPDRFGPASMANTHPLAEPPSSVLLPPQTADFSSIHQLDWQTWQPYSTI